MSAPEFGAAAMRPISENSVTGKVNSLDSAIKSLGGSLGRLIDDLEAVMTPQLVDAGCAGGTAQKQVASRLADEIDIQVSTIDGITGVIDDIRLRLNIS